MNNHSRKTYEVIIVGAGHGGLSVSYFLKAQDVSHLVLERGRIGESWRSQRWDSFALNTANWMTMLPGDTYEGDSPEGFMHRDEFVEYLTGYAKRFQLPVKEETRVHSVKKRSHGDVFEVTIEHGNHRDQLYCRQIVLASGVMSAPRIPSISRSLPDHILQLHAASFRNHTLLPEGAVLVVGSGQSGCQITEDLLEAGRKVHLATSRVGRVPRRYRGKDILEWGILVKFFDLATESVTDPQILNSPQPQVSGVGKYGHTVSLQDLNRQGASILGRLERVQGNELSFSNNAADHVRFADEVSLNFKRMVDHYILENRIACKDPENDPADSPDPSAACVEPTQCLNLRENQITSVIWATGFTADFNWVSPSVTDQSGMPVHVNGISGVKGVYFIGFPWLKSRKSGIVYGMNEDAKYIAENIVLDQITHVMP